MNARSESANLDFLRSVAVLCVLIAHLMEFHGCTRIGLCKLDGLGLFGVLLFFVHTSLVLMLSLERQDARSGSKRRASTFYLRRLFRIYPLSIFVVLIIVLFEIPSTDLRYHGLTYLQPDAIGLISNLLLVQNLTDAHSILGPLWSLPYEIQMYVFLPLLYLAVLRVRKTRTLVFLWTLAAGLAVLQPHMRGVPDFFVFVPCFFPGIMAYWFSKKIEPQYQAGGWVLFVLALVFMYALIVPDNVPDHVKVFAGIPFCLATGLGIPRFRELQLPALRRSGHLIAKYSYGIYLSHYFCMWLAFMHFARQPHFVQCVIFAVSLIAIPMVLYHGIEAPGIRIGNRLAKRLQVQPSPAPPLSEVDTAGSVR